MKKLLLLFTLSSVLLMPSCEKEPIDGPDDMDPKEITCDTEGITYNADIKSIFSGCQGSSCHGSGTGREMTDYASAKAFAQNGRIIGALNRDAGFSPMPKNGNKLDQCTIDKVKAWIDTDYPEG